MALVREELGLLVCELCWLSIWRYCSEYSCKESPRCAAADLPSLRSSVFEEGIVGDLMEKDGVFDRQRAQGAREGL